MEWTTLQEGLAGQASYSSSACTESDAENTYAHIIPAVGTVCASIHVCSNCMMMLLLCFPCYIIYMYMHYYGIYICSYGDSH